ncbi:hypothetical protein LEP1GSC062_3821 [Leptospira alexanderi serovar Manhao 3 str. L 60]|uniref:Uncharacterized protein n=1 Tax=Leptospira alexanderi serovar Manhao 3 str. L 60 TaxID=1049759 RepID=V6I8X3_9LEPT|nr:hypothetical protein LEP1GSC062_3821 [Leptospira alexanderi serovar Manhao 3 str. L 60]
MKHNLKSKQRLYSIFIVYLFISKTLAVTLGIYIFNFNYLSIM